MTCKSSKVEIVC